MQEEQNHDQQENSSEESIDWKNLKSYLEELKNQIILAKTTNSKENLTYAYDMSLSLCGVMYGHLKPPSSFPFFGKQHSMPGFYPNYTSTFNSDNKNQEENEEITLSMWIPKDSTSSNNQN